MPRRHLAGTPRTAAGARDVGGADRGTPAVRLAGLRKSYGHVAAVAGVDLEIAAGEFFTMLGPSGSGKTTLLRLIAGFERPDAGSVELAGRDVTRQPPYARDVNTVFQDYALFPHMTVARERRLRAAGPPGAQAGAAPPGRGRAGDGAAARAQRPQAGPAVRRPAPAGGAGPRDRQRARGPAAGRAARRPGPEAAPGDAAGAQADPARGRHHLHLRHPRPGGGADHERPPGRVQPGPDRAAGHAGGRVRAAGQRVRGRLHRRLQPAGARRPAVHDPPGEDPAAAG